ncbi:F-box domain - like 10, partial [Theobroma cacao]
ARFEDGKDIHRLNSLPDEIICHIISFLPLQEMIRTSILSRRWRYIFAQTSSLTIDDNDESPSDYVNFRFLLFNLANRVLFSRSRDTIDKFCLKFRQYVDIYHQIDGWLYYALRYGVQELELKLRKTYGLDLPGLPSAGCLFSCKMLVRLELKLGRNFIPEVPPTVRLPKLKVLHLEKVEFSDGESVQRLFSQCSMLEELIVKYCVWEDVNKFTVSNPTLKRLTLRRLRSISHQELEINAPSLVYFEHFDFVAKNYSLLNLQSLVEALIDVEPEIFRFFYPTPSTDLLRGIKAGLLRGISNIKSLHLGCNFSNAYGGRRIPKLDFIGFPFPNLTFLKIDTSFS